MPTFGFTNATLTATIPPTAPGGLTATATSSSNIDLNWTDNSANQTGFQIDQATSADFTQGLTTVTVGPTRPPTAPRVCRRAPRTTTACGPPPPWATLQHTHGERHDRFLGTSVAVAVPDGDFSADSPAYCVNSNSGGGTFTLPITGTLSGWTITATPSTANGGVYSGWEPLAGVDSVNSNGDSPWGNNAPWLGNQPGSSYNALSITLENCITEAAWWAAPTGRKPHNDDDRDQCGRCDG